MKPSERAHLIHEWKVAISRHAYDQAAIIAKELKNAVMEPEEVKQKTAGEPAQQAA